MSFNKNTIIIYDYDDTLMCTSLIVNNNIDITNKQSIEQYYIYFYELDNKVYELLNNSLKIGNVIIISNGTKQWLEMSIILLPKTCKLLNKIKLISARDENIKYTNSPIEWKKKSFLTHTHNYKNIISIGDGISEYLALINLMIKKNDDNFYLKTIKFMETPNINILLDEISVTNKMIKNIIYKKKNIDFVFNFL